MGSTDETQDMLVNERVTDALFHAVPVGVVYVYDGLDHPEWFNAPWPGQVGNAIEDALRNAEHVTQDVTD